MKQSEQARREDWADGKRNEEKLVQGTRPDGHWPEGQHAPLKDQGFDRSHQGAPRADDRSGYQGQSAYGSLEAAGGNIAPASDQPGAADHPRGGLSSYGNNLGSQYSVDQHAGEPAAASAWRQQGSAPGAAPDSTNVGQYGGEYDDMPNQREAASMESRAAENRPAQPCDTPQDDRSGATNLRGDQQLKEEIHERFLERPDLDIHDVSVTLRGGHATLEGSVPNAHMKEAILELVDNVSGVQNIDDQLVVQHVNPAQHATAQAYAVGGQVDDDVQHSGPATFGAASAKASAMKQQAGKKE